MLAHLDKKWALLRCDFPTHMSLREVEPVGSDPTSDLAAPSRLTTHGEALIEPKRAWAGGLFTTGDDVFVELNKHAS